MYKLIKKYNSYLINNFLNINYKNLNSILYLDIEYLRLIDEDEMNNLISFFTNRFINDFDIYGICVKNPYIFKKCFYKNMYYEKGEFLFRRVDNLRKIIVNNAFDDFGYIINQGLITNIKFGLFNTNHNGCGWIACFNLFKILNKEKSITNILNDLSKPFLLAQNIFPLYRYIRINNINAYLSPIFKKQCIRDIKESKCGIILYIHKRGSHYIAYKYLGDNKMMLYNAVYGLKNHIVDIDVFYKEYSITPFGMLISVK